MPVFPAIFERVAGNLLSMDGSATQLPAILLAILLGVDAPLGIDLRAVIIALRPWAIMAGLRLIPKQYHYKQSLPYKNHVGIVR